MDPELADSRCAPTRLLAKFLQTQRDQRLLIATRDDLAAVYAKNAIEMNRRQIDCIIVSQGLDPIMDGGASEKKEIDPNNRGSVVLGSVAYYMDRYGYDALPLALRPACRRDAAAAHGDPTHLGHCRQRIQKLRETTFSPRSPPARPDGVRARDQRIRLTFSAPGQFRLCRPGSGTAGQPQ